MHPSILVACFELQVDQAIAVLSPLADHFSAVGGHRTDEVRSNHPSGVSDQVSGVTIDEEMTQVIALQASFQAAAKVVSTVDQMLDVLMKI